jgi:predicted RNA methylase
MRVKKVAIAPEAEAVLREATVEGMIVRLPPRQLPRPVYEAVDKVLKALGGKWNRRAGGHVFPSDPAAQLAEALGDGAAKAVVDRKATLELFETPTPLARRMAEWAVPWSGVVLEPSAGRGRLVEAASFAGGVVHAIELDPENCDHLRKRFPTARVRQADFLAVTPPDEAPSYDAVVMNPPFRANADIGHVMHAFRFLKPGGRLAAVTSPHWTFARDKASRAFRAFLDTVAAIGGTFVHEKLPDGTFKDEGTTVATHLLMIQRPKALPA